MNHQLRDVLLSVRNPFRYIGGEVGSRAKPWGGADVRICLAFPDVYEMGMSHLGMAILYHIINDQPRMLADRAFAPWGDMEAELVKRKLPLFAIESQRPLSEFDIIGFSLAYELTYTNVLTMLRLGDIPFRASDRNESHPLIIAGGPCTFNPMPVSPFFDAIVIGDGENAILEIADAVRGWKGSKSPRMELLEKLSLIQGVFVPSLFNARRTTHDAPRILKAHISDLNMAPFPTTPVVPHAATQERAAIEVARGCGRGCRFCQAGFTYRPVRQRTLETTKSLACANIAASGSQDLSFLSLSIGDWAPLEDALHSLHKSLGDMPVNVSLPSLRVESISGVTLEALGPARDGGFTLAPEAGTEGMRRFINKGNSNAELYASVEKIFSNGWHTVKLYFMIGLPTETNADIEGIIQIANTCLDIGRKFHRRPEITVSVSTFVPKAHTPLQWERQIPIEEIISTQRELKRRLKRPGIFLRWHDAGMSFLEGVFSRGGPELASVTEIAHSKGARFDGWDECFDLGLWRDAFAKAHIAPEKYLNQRDVETGLPWEALGVGPSREFLIEERKRAYNLAETPDCTTSTCSGCGICDFGEIKNKTAHGPPGPWAPAPLRPRKAPMGPSVQGHRGTGAQGHVFKHRLRYLRHGRAAFLGPTHILDAIRRGLRASRLQLIYSQGFHPRPRISLGPALPIGVESDAEFADVLLGRFADPMEIITSLKGHLPSGMEVVEATPLPDDAPSIEDEINAIEYEARAIGTDILEGDIEGRIKRAIETPLVRQRGEFLTQVDINNYISELAWGDDNVLKVKILNRRPALKVSEVILHLLGLGHDDLGRILIKKVGVVWRTN